MRKIKYFWDYGSVIENAKEFSRSSSKFSIVAIIMISRSI